MRGTFWAFLLMVLFAVSMSARQGPLLLFTLLLALGTAASALWARYCLAGVAYRRQFAATRLEFGEETELMVEVINAKPLPLAWLRIRDEWPAEVALLTGRLGYSHKPNRRALQHWLAMRWYERVRRVYRLRGLRRGAFDFGPAELTSGDIFGFRWRENTLERVETVLVYPKIAPLWQWRLPSGRPLGEALAQRRLIEDPMRYAGVRDYVPGDSPRYIHWKNSARWRRLQTRVFDPEASRGIVLVVDVRTSDLGAYWVAPAYLELVISAAASIASDALDKRQAVGLYANAYAHRQWGITRVAVSRDPAQRTRLLEALARLTGFPQMPCEALIGNWMRALPFGATVVTISARPDESLQAALLALQDAGHPVVLLTVGEEPISAPAALDVHYLGGERAWKTLAAVEPA